MLPKQGRSKEALIAQMGTLRARDVNWRDGKVFSLVFYAGADVLELLHEASSMFFSENALNPTAFPSLRQMETETTQMVAALLHGGADAAGSMTAGGTESILMAVKTARDWARKKNPSLGRPNLVMPNSAHPAFVKAGHYLDVDMRIVQVADNGRADVAAMEAAIDANTVLLVGSAPSYPHGLLDPIEALAKVAVAKGVLFHVDACVGGLMLPFVEKLGHAVPPWDFRVPGVTSISADLHKYGYAAKGASTITYSTRELRKAQFEVHVDWSGGIWASPSATGTRPGGPIAAAWAVWNYLGEEGYLRLARTALDATHALQAGVRSIPGLRVVGEPEMTVFAIGSDELDLYALADRMQERGWMLDRQHKPATLHLTVTPAHAAHVDAIVAALRESADEIRGKTDSGEGTAAMYGMLGSMPDRALVGNFVLDLLDGFDRRS
ncbi:MAG: aspartate aminotransferase family protein [Polyangia bacterium]